MLNTDGIDQGRLKHGSRLVSGTLQSARKAVAISDVLALEASLAELASESAGGMTLVAESRSKNARIRRMALTGLQDGCSRVDLGHGAL